MAANTLKGAVAAGDPQDLTPAQVRSLLSLGALALKTSVVTGDLADEAVTTAKLATGSVATAKIPDGAVTLPKLAPSAIATTVQALAGTPDVLVTAERMKEAMSAQDGKMPLPYSGSSATAVDYPIGHIVLTWDVAFARNAVVAPRLAGTNDFTSGASGTLLSGIYRARGNFNVPNGGRTTLAQRTE